MKNSDEYYISLIGEAFDGYTETSFEGETIFLKHVSIKDQRYLHKYYEKYKKIALAKGLDCEEDRLKTIKDDGMWSSADDSKISSLEFEVKNLQRTAKALPLRSQRENIQKDVDSKILTLTELKLKRKEIIGKTAEDYATQRSADEILRFLLFKDEKLKKHFFSDEEFGDLEAWQILKLAEIQDKLAKTISDINIQKAVLRPFFQMYLSFCENPYSFYEKPVTHLTIFQLKVLLYGRMFHNIFQYTEDIPDDIKQDPEKLMAFSESQRNKGVSKDLVRDDADGSVLFGATNEDIKDLEGSRGGVSLSDEIEKHGGKLDMKQMMRLAGHDV